MLPAGSNAGSCLVRVLHSPEHLPRQWSCSGLSPHIPISNQDNFPHPHSPIYRPVWSGESLNWDPLLEWFHAVLSWQLKLIGKSCEKVQTGNAVVTHFFGPVFAAQELCPLSFCLYSFHVWPDKKLLSKTLFSRRSVKIIFPIYQTRTWSQYLIWQSTAWHRDAWAKSTWG